MNPIRRPALLTRLAVALLAAGSTAASAASDPAQTLRWRLVGPMRGGWSTVAQGIADQPDTYYFGAAGGGVWKTTDAGATWHSVFDAVAAANIGALAVAPSDPSTIYVGTGQVAARYDVGAGNGVYKSSDGGKTWTHAGLERTRHIGAVLVDPRDANRVLVAALGHYFGPNKERGVFRSEDGGKTWQQTLFINADTGTVDLAADPGNPDIVYAAAWQVRNYPWLSYFMPNAGPGSGIFRSSDGGKSWKRLKGHGWPDATLGRIGLATAKGGRVYAVVNAAPYSGNTAHSAVKDAGGLYRSDDGGASWQRVSSESWLENDYFGRITADPVDRDRLYASGRSIRRSDDGGAHWTIVKGAPGGDDYHYIWINPKYPEHMVVASDQGTAVTSNGGSTWSDWYNQPTGQFYHIATDHRFPYWIYSGQQDSGTVGAASRSDYGVLGFRDWHPVGGDERDYDIPDPRNPGIVYGSGLGGRLSRWDARTGEVQNISPWPLTSYGERPTDVKYRYTWITPIAVSWFPPYPIYQGAQVLFRSTDQGNTWKAISPDLSAKSKSGKACEGKLAAPAARACGYGVIYTIALPPRNNDEIWVGTDDGLIQHTADGGEHWTNLTPTKLVPEWAKVASIDISRAIPRLVYAAIDNHRQDDFSPHVLRSLDSGKTWTEAVNGLPPNSFVDVVRTDPVKPGLLYAGTDLGVYVSYDNGDHWRPLQNGLPHAWVRDLNVYHDDLIAATQGRGIWVLDNVMPLRQHEKIGRGDQPVLFQPATVVRVRGSQNRDTPPPADTALAQNPPTGAMIDYYLPHDAGKVELEILASDGTLVRRFASDQAPDRPKAERYFTKSWTQPPQALSAAAGTHRFVWNLRGPRPRAVHHDYSISAVFGEGTPITPRGELVLAGPYTVALTVDGKRLRTSLNIIHDPRVAPDPKAESAAIAFHGEIAKALERNYVAYGELQAVDRQVAVAGGKTASRALRTAIERLDKATAKLKSGDSETSMKLAAIGEALSALAADVEASDRVPTQPQHALLAACNERMTRASDLWERVKRRELAAVDAQLEAAGLAPISIPAPDQIELGDAPESKDLP